MNRLSFLMDFFDLNSSELASIAHVDRSLVSKWRNGHRILRRSSDYAYLISQHIYELDQRNLKQLDKILSESNSDYAHMEEEEKVCYLNFWLTDGSIKPSLAPDNKDANILYSNQVGYKVFKAEVNKLLSEKTKYISGSVTLVIYNNTSLFTDDGQWLGKIIELFHHLLKGGTQVRVYVNGSTPNPSTQFFISHMVRLMIYKNFQLTYEGDHFDLKRHEIYLMNDNQLIRGIGTSKDIFFELLNQKYTCSAYINYFDNLFIKSKVHHYEIEEIDKLFNKIIQAGTRRDHSYYMSGQLFFTCMSMDLLEEVLEANHCTMDEMNRCFDLYEKLTSNFKTNTRQFDNVHIYYENALEKCLEVEAYTDTHLSSMLCRPITISSKQFVKLLISTIERLKKYDNFQVMMMTQDEVDLTEHSPNCWVKDAETIIIWNFDLKPMAATIKAPDLIDTMIDNIKNQYIQKTSKIKLRNKTINANFPSFIILKRFSPLFIV